MINTKPFFRSFYYLFDIILLTSNAPCVECHIKGVFSIASIERNYRLNSYSLKIFVPVSLILNLLIPSFRVWMIVNTIHDVNTSFKFFQNQLRNSHIYTTFTLVQFDKKVDLISTSRFSHSLHALMWVCYMLKFLEEQQWQHVC